MVLIKHPCCIFSALQNDAFVFRERGNLTVKGKGEMNTYFLIGKPSDTREPTDEYINLPVLTTVGTENVDNLSSVSTGEAGKSDILPILQVTETESSDNGNVGSTSSYLNNNENESTMKLRSISNGEYTKVQSSTCCIL